MELTDLNSLTQQPSRAMSLQHHSGGEREGERVGDRDREGGREGKGAE